jgi:hypothetical protein
MSKIKIINLSPHDLVIYKGDNKINTIPSSGNARVEEEKTKTGEINGVPVYKKSYSKVKGLPTEQEDTYYYVSSLVAANSDRDDLLVPGEFVRDENGRIFGIKSFAQL